MKRVVLISATVAAMVAGCAQFAPHRARLAGVSPSSRSNPGPLRPSDPPPRNDLIVLLPKPNGKIGGVVARTDGGKAIVLHKAYAGAHIDGPGEIRPITFVADRVQREFFFVTAALPGRPAIFLL